MRNRFLFLTIQFMVFCYNTMNRQRQQHRIGESQLLFFPCYSHSILKHLMTRLFFPCYYTLHRPFCHNLCSYICESVSDISFMFCWFVCLSLCQYHTVLFITFVRHFWKQLQDLKSNLIPNYGHFSYLVLFCKNILPILGSGHFCIHIRIVCQVP